MKRIALVALASLALAAEAVPASAHCQIPCWIFDDELRVQLIEEDIGTIEKSMQQIVELGAAETVNYNQLVR
ncbi:MAG TPA: superoxide dismutase [Ni], partial [Candidatus Sulfomarinibacteraceae bacterium]|nr:superoxide dismutase [Ni] [Candidatus Sulfomarinibacteraceae bacterium]